MFHGREGRNATELVATMGMLAGNPGEVAVNVSFTSCCEKQAQDDVSAC
jgi:hypothetical protein